MFDVTLGVGLLAVALTTQYLISKRLKHKGLRKGLAWVAWGLAVVGGTAVTADINPQIGVTSAGAVIASLVMLLFIAVDLADRRPDWLAFILICICPTFMRLSGGTAGQLFDMVLFIPQWAANGLAAFLGM